MKKNLNMKLILKLVSLSESEGDLSSEVEEETTTTTMMMRKRRRESKLMKSKPRHSTTAASFKEWAEQQVRIMEENKNVLTPEVSEEIEKYSKQTVRDEDVDHSSDEEGYIL